MTSQSSASDMPGSWNWPSDLADSLRSRHQAASQQPPPGPPPNVHEAERQQGQRKQRHWHPRTCRICLETILPTFHTPSEHVPQMFQGEARVTYDSEGGKLISPCKCKGSQKYVHEECLQAWRNSNPSLTTRTFWECPTCKFKYRFSRLSWGRMIGGVGAQIVLTVVIFLLAVFALGFIADPIITMALDPHGHIFNLWNAFSSERGQYFPDEPDVDMDPGGWVQHFTKGFASLGLLGVLKYMLSSPLQFFFRQAPVGRRRGAGDRLQTTTWLMILIGAATVVFGVWKMVRAWSRRVLERAGDRVMDVQGDEDDDDDDE